MIRKLLLTTAFLSIFATAVHGKEIAFLVDGDTGGKTKLYEEKAQAIGRSKVIIDGLCLSACTMFLRKDWALDVCYTESALFGFHKPFQWDKDHVVTGISAITQADTDWRVMFFEQMPSRVQALLTGKQIPAPAAGDPTSRFIYVKARDLRGAVKRCEPNWSAKYDLINVEDVY